MTHLWVRSEQRPNEDRTGLTPEGAGKLIAKGLRVTVEESQSRIISLDGYRAAGCEIAPENSWPDAPRDAIIFGLKELPDDSTPLPHRHIMFGHAFKGQHAGRRLLERFKAGGGTLYDLEYLTHPDGRRVAAFGYWAGFVGAAVGILGVAHLSSARPGVVDESFPSLSPYADREALIAAVEAALASAALQRDLRFCWCSARPSEWIS